jgi:hypothetical protein
METRRIGLTAFRQGFFRTDATLERGTPTVAWSAVGTAIVTALTRLRSE